MTKSILLFNRKIENPSITLLQTHIEGLVKEGINQIEILLSSHGGSIIYLQGFEEFLKKVDKIDIKVINIDRLESSGLILFLLFPFEKRHHLLNTEFLFHSVFYNGDPMEEDEFKTMELNMWQTKILTTNSKFPANEAFKVLTNKKDKPLSEKEVKDFQISNPIPSFSISTRVLTI